MTSLYWPVIGASVAIYFTLTAAANTLGKIANLLAQINEHARIIRQHELPEIVRHLEAINRNVCNLKD